jgi:hypothetical protein
MQRTAGENAEDCEEFDELEELGSKNVGVKTLRNNREMQKTAGENAEDCQEIEDFRSSGRRTLVWKPSEQLEERRCRGRQERIQRTPQGRMQRTETSLLGEPAGPNRRWLPRGTSIGGWE